MEKEKTFEELARSVAEKQDNDEMLIGTDIESASKLGVPKIVRGAATEEEKAQVRDMYRKGIGVCEIARRTGFAQSTISRWCGTWGLDKSKSVRSTKQTTKNEPAPEATGTSPNKNILHLDDTTLLEICQEAMLKVCDRIIEVDGDAYILGYIHSVLDVINKLKNIKEDKDE